MAKSKVGYVDGFVLVVPKNKLAQYRKMAKDGARVWLKYGALGYKECMLNDAKPKYITFTFAKMAKAKPNETVWFSYIEYKNKKHRNQVNARVMKDPSMNPDSMANMPFDMKRMANGGFSVIVSD